MAMSRRLLVEGHRGARAIYPENTIPGFRYAIQAGADAVEMDVAVTQDDVLVISHDPHIQSVAIREMTQANTRLPTLDEVLSLANQGDFLFNIEIKSFPDHPELTPPPEEFSRMVLEEIRGHGLAPRVIVQSFDFRTLLAMGRMTPEIRLAALWEGEPRSFVSIAREAKASIIAPEFHLVTRERVEEAHAANLEVAAWTANTPEDWQKLMEAGVDAIITDDPGALIAYLAYLK
jgi:glycerophosphoryl diester phosphodiesterase